MLVSEHTANPSSLVSASFLTVSAVFWAMGCCSTSLVKEWCVYFAFPLECSHKGHFFLCLHCPKTHPFITFTQYLSSPATNHPVLVIPSKGSFQPIPTQATNVSNSKMNYDPLGLVLNPVLLHLLTKLQMALMLSPEIPSYQARLSLNIHEHSLSAPKTFSCQKATQKHWLGDELTIQWHDDQYLCCSAGQF